jgi:superfamily II DNA or RNA helicase
MAKSSASCSASKSKSQLKAAPLSYSSKRSSSGETAALSPVSWKRLHKRSPWLKLLRPHQVSGTEAIVSTDGFAALFEQRTGKTWVTGAVLEVEWDIIHDVLLVGPLTNLESTWAKFLAEKIPGYSVHRDLESYLEQRKYDETRHKAFADPIGHRILLLNYEAVTPILKKLRRLRWGRIVYDEAQRLKNRASRSSRDAGLLSASADRRLVLTGTPIDRNPRDLWAVMRFIAPYVFGTVWKDFARDYLAEPVLDAEKMKKGAISRKKEMMRYQIAKGKAPIRDDMIQQYADLAAPHMMRISKEQAGIERAKVRKVRFNLDDYEEKKYRQLEKTMLLKHQGTVVKAPLKITQIGKLQQITGGHIKDEEGEVHRIGTSKRRLLRRLLKKHTRPGEPFVIFCKYVFEVHALARMIERAGYGKGAKLWGKVKDLKKDKRRTNMLLAFQRGEYPWIICQQRTGGVGVDLYRARKFFVYSMGHSYIDYDQMLSRGDFLEQTEPAEFFLLLARLTIDTDICHSVEDKKSITETFYDRLNRNVISAKKGHSTMAKNKKKETEAETSSEFKYGVQDIADQLDIKPASVRVQLRNKGIEKAGKSYGWNSKSELKEVIAQLKAPADDDDDEAPKKAKKSKKSKGDDAAPKKAKKDKAKKAKKPKKGKKSKDEEDDDDD